jgi:acyl-CoA reductase-like NAD-dependent aldehyde dehydrogenase
MSTRNEVSAAAVLPANTATQLYIAGKWRDSSDGDAFIDLNPTTEEPLAVVAAATAADVDAAVRAAQSQLCGEWGATPGVARGKLLNRIADLIERDGELLARLEALDVSKPISQPKMLDIPNAAATFRHFAGWADKISGATIPTTGYFGKPTHSYTVREPVGVARDGGARVAAGGRRPDMAGLFIEPTIFADVEPDAKIARKRSSVQSERSCPSTPPRKPSRSQTAPCTDWLRVSGLAMCPTRTSWLRRFELALCG